MAEDREKKSTSEDESLKEFLDECVPLGDVVEAAPGLDEEVEAMLMRVSCSRGKGSLV